MGTQMGSSRIRKQITNLTIADLITYPIWEFASDEENVDGQDETTVRPYHHDGDLDPEGGGQFLVLASFVLADGSRMEGLLTPSRDASAIVHPTIVTPGGHVGFWCGRLVPKPGDIANDYARLGKASAAQIFPIQYASEVPLSCGPVRGEIAGFMVLENDYKSVKIIT